MFSRGTRAVSNVGRVRAVSRLKSITMFDCGYLSNKRAAWTCARKTAFCFCVHLFASYDPLKIVGTLDANKDHRLDLFSIAKLAALASAGSLLLFLFHTKSQLCISLLESSINVH